jgi:sec-independent protein translocase protein TatC
MDGSLTKYLDEIRLRILKVTIALSLFISISMFLSIRVFDFYGYRIPFLYFDPLNNLSSQVLIVMKESLLPKSVTLVQFSPGEAFFAQIYVAIMLGIILTMPILIREVIGFILPGLYLEERVMLRNVMVAAVALFVIGCLFSYFVAIPYMIDFLYKYGQSLDVTTLLKISEFIPFVVQFLFAFGLSYQLPVIMWAATKSGIVKANYWRNNARYVLIIFAIFGAIITPDGSGVTMWFVAGPMVIIYILGMLIVEKGTRKMQYVGRSTT